MNSEKAVAAFLSLLFLLPARAQWGEDFSDGNLTQDPAWSGQLPDWLVNGNKELQSASLAANTSFYISTPSTAAMGMQWEFTARLLFNTSSANYVDVYLLASDPDPMSNSNKGYFVRIGNTNDELSLYRRDAGGTLVKLIDGSDGLTNTSSNHLRIRVARSNTGKFYLLRDSTGTGNHFISEGSAPDSTYTSSQYFIIQARQSTAGFFQKHFFDDLSITPFVPDTTAPQLMHIQAAGPQSIDLYFSESVEANSSNPPYHYVLNGSLTPLTAQRAAGEPSRVRLTFNHTFTVGQSYHLTVNSIADPWGNTLQPATRTFLFYLAGRYDVVIHELMADPSPVVGLPNAEYIELRNRSSHHLQLQGWKVAAGGDSSGPLPPLLLPPDSFLLLTSSSNAALFSRATGISQFPSLPNEGGTVVLISQEGATIDALEYNTGLYGSAVKKEGGWSLEMIDAARHCAQGNWKGSTDPSGGTPGKANAVRGINDNDDPPRLIRTYSTSPRSVIALFDHMLDSSMAAQSTHYTLDGNLFIQKAKPLSPLYREVELTLTTPMDSNRIYTLSVQNVKDCSGQAIGPGQQAKCGRASVAEARDIVINEILFDPPSGGKDYIELYNRSPKIIDAASLYLGNRNVTGAASAPLRISTFPFFIYPGDHLVLTEDAGVLALFYLVKKKEQVLELSLPSLPDDEGRVVLWGSQGGVIDEVHYLNDWHYALLSSRQGVSLERIDPEGPSDQKENWHSAASSAGYGTPGYLNSQHRNGERGAQTITVTPKIFSPNSDGQDDFTLIHYQLDAPGYMATVTLFNLEGRPVKLLVPNLLLGRSGYWKWDGLNDKGLRVPAGVYIILSEFFNLEGKKMRRKDTVIVER